MKEANQVVRLPALFCLAKNDDGFGDEDPEFARLTLVRLLECIVKGGDLLSIN